MKEQRGGVGAVLLCLTMPKDEMGEYGHSVLCY